MNKLIDQLESNYKRIREIVLPIDDAGRHKCLMQQYQILI